MSIKVHTSQWNNRDGELARRYIYEDPSTGRHIFTLFFRDKLEAGALAVHDMIFFVLEPFRVSEGLELYVSLTSRDEPIDRCYARASVHGDENSALVHIMMPSDARKIVSAMCSGKELRFTLFQGDEQLIEMPFPNDLEFRGLRNSIYLKLTEQADYGPKTKSWIQRMFGG